MSLLLESHLDSNFTFSRAHLSHSEEKRYVYNGVHYGRQFQKIVKGKIKPNLKDISEITAVSNSKVPCLFTLKVRK